MSMKAARTRDTVQVNGSTAAADVFTVAANGTRIRFDRTNLGLFSLDIGTTETLIVNGIGGDDSFTVNDLTGVASLTALNLNGFDGNDLFTFVPASAGAVLFNVHGGAGTDTLQGPNAASTWNVTAANLGNITGLVSSFRFVEALSGGTASDTFNVKAFASGTPTVTGGAGADTLNYNAESRAVSGDTTPPDGVIDSPGVQSVTFSQIETVNITNPQPQIAINDVTVAEGGAPTSAVFNVTLSNPSLLPVTVNFATANGHRHGSRRLHGANWHADLRAGRDAQDHHGANHRRRRSRADRDLLRLPVRRRSTPSSRTRMAWARSRITTSAASRSTM